MNADNDQEVKLNECVRKARQEAFQMKRCLDRSKLNEAMKHASEMLLELRASALSPKNYYELYMAICDELSHLEMFLLDEFQKGNRVAELYELVQYAGSIVPRLYLLITVGAVFIKTNETSRREILHDLVEMCRGVQHPLRGLFLRNYLLQETKNVLPDVRQGEASEFKASDVPEAGVAPDGSIDDSIDFIITNFSEMNKLWVRMQHQGHSKDRVKREKERQDLRLLVGTNLVRLSSLETVDVVMYQKTVLPCILEQVVSCRDMIAQEYLMEVIIQVFPDEFHIHTLSTFLNACSQLNSGVNVKNIYVSMISRISIWAERDKRTSEVLSNDLKLFDTFNKHIGDLINDKKRSVPGQDIVALYMSLVTLAIKCYKEKLDLVDSSFKCVFQTLDKSSEGKALPAACCAELVKLLKLPINSYASTLTLLKLEWYSSVFKLLDYVTRQEVALHLIQNTLEKGTVIDTQDDTDKLFTLIESLLADDEQHTIKDSNDELFVEQQTTVGRLITRYAKVIDLKDISTLDNAFGLLRTIRKHVGRGGAARAVYTLPPIVYQSLELARMYALKRDEDENWQKKCKKIFQFAHQTVSALVQFELYALALRIFLDSALAVSSIVCKDHDTVVYEFFTQAYSLYEEEMSDSKQKYAAILLISGCLQKTECFNNEMHEPLRTNLALAAAKLLKKPDQCRALLAVANLFWDAKVINADADDDNTAKELKDEKRVLDCLKRAVKFANQCMDLHVKVNLFVEIFSAYVTFVNRGVQVPNEILKQLHEKVKDEMSQLEETSAPDLVQLKNQFSAAADMLYIERPKALK